MKEVKLWLFELFEYYQGYRKLMLFWAFSLTTYQTYRSNNSHDLAIEYGSDLGAFAVSTGSIMLTVTGLTAWAYKIYSDSRDKQAEAVNNPASQFSKEQN